MVDRGTTTVEAVSTAITNAVRAGLLAPGQRLVESEFTDRLGVSRSSVREAFRRLTADGLLMFEPNRGVAVRHLSRREVDNLFDIRQTLEALAVRRALPSLSKAPKQMLAIQKAMDEAVEAGELDRFSDLNRRFHALFSNGADNPTLTEMIGRLGNSIYWLQFRVLVEPRHIWETNKQHRQLVEAVVAGDVAVAEATIMMHVDTSRQLIQGLSDLHFMSNRSFG